MMSTISIAKLIFERNPSLSGFRAILPGFFSLILALPLTATLVYFNNKYPMNPEKAVLVIAAVFLAILIVPPGIYGLVKRELVEPWKLVLVLLATMGVLLVSIYFYWVGFYIKFPGDFLIWSESDFVNDIIKFRIGYPLYSAEVNNESFTYPPGAQLITYFFAMVFGSPTSIPTYRLIQLGFTIIAAIVATACCGLLVELRSTKEQENAFPWSFIWLPFLFLIASNSRTNPFVHLLHNDALAQLITVIAYLLLLLYKKSRNKLIFGSMIILPIMGLYVKQSLIIWSLFYGLYLVLFDQPRSIKRTLIFGLFTIIGTALAIVLGYMLWGDHFMYWVFTVLGKHGVSSLRSFRHLLNLWPHVAIILFGGYVLLRGERLLNLGALWLIGLMLILSQIYTSGVAWMTNHVGSGSLIAGIWFMASLTDIWALQDEREENASLLSIWMRTGILFGIVSLTLGGLGIVKIPMRPLDEDAYRYLSQIEDEFTGYSPEAVLLDVGSWIYLQNDVVMMDRAPSIGERGYSGTGDFSGIIQRIQEKSYSKILLRNYHSDDFWYDHKSWQHSSGIRRSLRENYREVRTIPELENHDGYLFREISVLVPNKP